jgi:hypothetical protein
MALNSSVAASSIGAEAWRRAGSACALRVIGLTARGVFLLAPPQQVVFVSTEHYRSPLTINLDRSCEHLGRLAVGAAAQFSGTRLIFPAIEFAISLSEHVVWHCPLPDTALRPPAEQRQTAQAIGAGVLAQRGEDGLAALLPILLDQPAISPLSAEQSALLDRLMTLRGAVQANDTPAVIAGLSGLLGQGRGLTPSGDDVVIGLLLMLARSLRLKSQAGSENMLKHVVAAAYQQTTTISANLIECAASGQGDERLIAMVDGILTGAPSIDECVEGALDWGSSSGIAALAGMALAVAQFNPPGGCQPPGG